MATGKVTLNMSKERETKGTVVYQEDVSGDARGHQFYVLKDTASAVGTPDKIKLTIESA